MFRKATSLVLKTTATLHHHHHHYSLIKCKYSPSTFSITNNSSFINNQSSSMSNLAKLVSTIEQVRQALPAAEKTEPMVEQQSTTTQTVIHPATAPHVVSSDSSSSNNNQIPLMQEGNNRFKWWPHLKRMLIVMMGLFLFIVPLLTFESYQYFGQYYFDISFSFSNILFSVLVLALFILSVTKMSSRQVGIALVSSVSIPIIDVLAKNDKENKLNTRLSAAKDLKNVLEKVEGDKKRFFMADALLVLDSKNDDRSLLEDFIRDVHVKLLRNYFSFLSFGDNYLQFREFTIMKFLYTNYREDYLLRELAKLSHEYDDLINSIYFSHRNSRKRKIMNVGVNRFVRNLTNPEDIRDKVGFGKKKVKITLWRETSSGTVYPLKVLRDNRKEFSEESIENERKLKEYVTDNDRKILETILKSIRLLDPLDYHLTLKKFTNCLENERFTHEDRKKLIYSQLNQLEKEWLDIYQKQIDGKSLEEILQSSLMEELRKQRKDGIN